MKSILFRLLKLLLPMPLIGPLFGRAVFSSFANTTMPRPYPYSAWTPLPSGTAQPYRFDQSGKRTWTPSCR